MGRPRMYERIDMAEAREERITGKADDIKNLLYGFVTAFFIAQAVHMVIIGVLIWGVFSK